KFAEDKKAGEVLVFGQFHDVLKKHFKEQKATVLDEGTISGGVFKPTEGKLTALAIKEDFGVEVEVAGSTEGKTDGGKEEKAPVVLAEPKPKEEGAPKDTESEEQKLERLIETLQKKLTTETDSKEQNKLSFLIAKAEAKLAELRGEAYPGLQPQAPNQPQPT